MGKVSTSSHRNIKIMILIQTQWNARKWVSKLVNIVLIDKCIKWHVLEKSVCKVACIEGCMYCYINHYMHTYMIYTGKTYESYNKRIHKHNKNKICTHILMLNKNMHIQRSMVWRNGIAQMCSKRNRDRGTTSKNNRWVTEVFIQRKRIYIYIYIYIL